MTSFSRQGIVFCLVGPAGVGKSSLAKVLLERFGPRLRTSVSVTSRSPRQGEVPGESYIFVSRDEFQQMAKDGEFLEWEETHGNLYGTPKASFEKSLVAGEDILLDIDIRGAKSFRQFYPHQTVVLALLPPDAAALEGRMTKRGSTSPEEMKVRMETARGELLTLLKEIGPEGAVDFVVLNEDFHDSSEIVSSIYLATTKRGENIEEKSFEKYIESLREELS